MVSGICCSCCFVLFLLQKIGQDMNQRELLHKKRVGENNPESLSAQSLPYTFVSWSPAVVSQAWSISVPFTE